MDMSPFITGKRAEVSALNNKKSQIKETFLPLLAAYAKAEANFTYYDDMFEQLKTLWGITLSTAIKKIE